MDISFQTGEGHFNLRAVGIFLHEGRLLAARDTQAGYFFLPGGRVKLNETSEQAIRREMREELGMEVTIHRMLWAVENIFTRGQTGEKFHELGLYYLLSPAQGQAFRAEPEFETREEDGQTNRFAWLELARVKDTCIYPEFIREEIYRIPEKVIHIMQKK